MLQGSFAQLATRIGTKKTNISQLFSFTIFNFCYCPYTFAKHNNGVFTCLSR